MFLVTGASGFLGRPLVERLAQSGATVRAMVRGEAPSPFPAGVDVVRASLDDGASLRRAVAGCATVLHLAGRAHVLEDGDPGAFRRSNVDGTARLLEAAAAEGVGTFVLASSVKAMGEGGDACLDEDAPAAPVTPYGRSKLEAEELARAAGFRSAMRAVVLRFPLVYGPALKGNLRAMLDGIARGTFPPLPRVSNRRSLASVDDAVTAFVLAAEKPAAAGRTYLVTDGAVYSSRDLYDAMREALGLAPSRLSVPLAVFRAAARAGEAFTRATGRPPAFSSAAFEKLFGSAWYSNERIRRELGFSPATTLRDGLRAALAEGARR